MSTRAWRGLALVALAALGVGVVGVVHLARRPLAPHPTPALGPVVPQWVLGLASFGDVDHGAVVMGGGRPTTGDTYVTADGGRTWTPRHVGLSATTFLDRDHAIASVPVPTFRLESSGDAGRTWVRLRAPFPAAPPGYLLNRATGGPTFLDPENGWWLEAPTPPLPGPVALWRTRNGGRTWQELSAAGVPTGWLLGGPAFVDQTAGALVAVPGHGPDLVVLDTRDGGQTWSPAARPDAPVGGPGVALVGANAAQLLVDRGRLVVSIDLTVPGGGEFVHWTSVSQDGGQTWAPWVKEPAGAASAYAAPIVDDGGRLLVVDDQTLWTSGDDGRTWQPRQLRLAADEHAQAVVFAGTGSLIVVTAGAPPTGMTDLRLLRSDDGGGRWTRLRLPSRPVS